MPMLSLKHFLLRAEGKALYRDTLRALRGVDAATAQSIRESARAMYADNAAEGDPDRIRVLLIDGRHSLKEMCQCLGTAVVRPETNVSDTPTPTSAVSSNGRSSVSRK